MTSPHSTLPAGDLVTDADFLFGDAPFDLASNVAVRVMQLPWTPSGTDDEHADRYGDVQNAVSAALAASPALASPQHPVGVRQASPTVENVARSAAVAAIDAIHGYTMEFAPSPAQHSHDYDVAERAILRELDTLSRPPAQDAPGAVKVKALEWYPHFGYAASAKLGVGSARIMDLDDGSFHFEVQLGEIEGYSDTLDAAKAAVIERLENLLSSFATAALDPSPPLPEADGEIVTYRWRYEDQPDNWSYSRQKPRLASLPNVVCEPLVRQSALVSALRERDEAREKEAATAAEADHWKRRFEYWRKKCEAQQTAREKAEQVAAGLREEAAEDERDRLYAQADDGMRAAERDRDDYDYNLHLGGLVWLKSFDAMHPSERAALRASTEEGKTAPPSVKQEEAGR